MFKIDGFTITSFDNLTGYDLDGNLNIVMENLQDFSLDQEDEKTLLKPDFDIRTFKKNSAVTGSGTNNILNLDSYEMLLGESFIEDNYTIRYADVVTVKDNTVSLNKTPIGRQGKEISSICIGTTKKQRPLKMKQVTGNIQDNNSFIYFADSNTIGFNSGRFEDEASLIVYYDIITEGSRIINYVYHSNKILEIYIDVSCQGVNKDEKFKGQFHIFQADFSGDFSITGNNDKAVQSFEFRSLGDKRGSKLVHWDFTVFNPKIPKKLYTGYGAT